MILSMLDDPKRFVFTVKPIGSNETIEQVILDPPINRYKINKHKQKLLNKYPKIVSVKFRENSFTREQASQMNMGI